MKIEINRISAINLLLNNEETGATIADQEGDFVRLWTLSFQFSDKRSLNALKRFFPNLETKDSLIKLGQYNTLADAHGDLADAKTDAKSAKVKGLFLVTSEFTLKTIKKFS